MDRARLRLPWNPMTGAFRAPDEKTIRVVLDRLDPRSLSRALLGHGRRVDRHRSDGAPTRSVREYRAAGRRCPQIEPTSKLDTVRILTEVRIACPHRVTFMRCLKRVVERDYRAVVAQACYRHATWAASLAVVLYD